jgi:hypothetical protein
MHILLLDPVADQAKNEIDKRVNSVVMLFHAKPE